VLKPPSTPSGYATGSQQCWIAFEDEFGVWSRGFCQKASEFVNEKIKKSEKRHFLSYFRLTKGMYIVLLSVANFLFGLDFTLKKARPFCNISYFWHSFENDPAFINTTKKIKDWCLIFRKVLNVLLIQHFWLNDFFKFAFLS